MVKDNIDILMVSKTKLDSSFPQAQLRIQGYAPPFRYDRTSHGGGIRLFIREDIPTKIISITPLKDFEGIFVELNFRKKKILFCYSYNPHTNLISNHLNILGKILDTHMKIHDNFLIVGDFNSEMTESAMKNFCGTYQLHNLIKDRTCFKNLNKPSCIDLLLTNFPKSFLKSQILETGLSDFHKLTLTVLKRHYKKQKPLVVTYRDYKNFSNESFRTELLSTKERYSNISFADFHSKFFYLLGKHAPVKKSYIRANQKNFMDKELNQAIMVRSKIRNKFLKLKTEENRLAYAKHRNYCVKLLQEKKRQYFKNLNLSSITNNKLFWKTVSPLFTEKMGPRTTK